MGGNANYAITSSVRPSVCFHSIFWTDWLLTVNFCVPVGHDRSSQGPLPSSIDSIWVVMVHCLEVKREDNQNCSVLCCVGPTTVVHNDTQLRTQMRAVLTILWTRFCHIGPISLCVDLFVFVFYVFLFHTVTLHSCCIIVSTVGCTWWDWSLVFRNKLLSLLWHCWFGHLIRKNPYPIWPIMCLVGR